jgi:hypothetical protein
MIRSLSSCGGWRGSALLLAGHLALEAGSRLLGGDWGAFVYVTGHSVVVPILSVGMILVTLGMTLRSEGKTWARAATLSSVVVPAALLALAASGEPGLARLLPAS